jgi:SNF family Na+-dependent transporter
VQPKKLDRRTANLWLATLLPFFIAVAVGVPLLTGVDGTVERVTRLVVVLLCLCVCVLAGRSLFRGHRRASQL